MVLLVTEPNGTFSCELQQHQRVDHCNPEGHVGLHSLSKWPFGKKCRSLFASYSQSQLYFVLRAADKCHRTQGSLTLEPLHGTQLTTAMALIKATNPGTSHSSWLPVSWILSVHAFCIPESADVMLV